MGRLWRRRAALRTAPMSLRIFAIKWTFSIELRFNDAPPSASGRASPADAARMGELKARLRACVQFLQGCVVMLA